MRMITLENNVNSTEFLTNFLQKANNKAPIIFASSVQVNNFSIYSQTKKAEDILIKHSKKINLKFLFLDYLMFLGSGLNQIITHLYLPLLIMLLIIRQLIFGTEIKTLNYYILMI